MINYSSKSRILEFPSIHKSYTQHNYQDLKSYGYMGNKGKIQLPRLINNLRGKQVTLNSTSLFHIVNYGKPKFCCR